GVGGGGGRGEGARVADVVVPLPVQGIVLVQPRNVPGGDPRHRHGGIALPAGPDRVFRVVPFDEHGYGEADLPDDLRGDQAHPPAVVVGFGATVQPRGIPQVPAA